MEIPSSQKVGVCEAAFRRRTAFRPSPFLSCYWEEIRQVGRLSYNCLLNESTGRVLRLPAGAWREMFFRISIRQDPMLFENAPLRLRGDLTALRIRPARRGKDSTILICRRRLSQRWRRGPLADRGYWR